MYTITILKTHDDFSNDPSFMRGLLDANAGLTDPIAEDVRGSIPKLIIKLESEVVTKVRKVLKDKPDVGTGTLILSGLEIIDLLYPYMNFDSKIPLSSFALEYGGLMKWTPGTSNYIKVKKISEDAVTPSKTHGSDVGYDLHLIELLDDDETVYTFNTGLVVEPPFGMHLEVVPRSSLQKEGWTLANVMGIIDPSYRGQIKVKLVKLRADAEIPKLPWRAVQMITRKTEYPQLHVVSDVSNTKRGEGGFGSTDKPTKE